MARENVVFIRPPKVAGTSISEALGLEEVLKRKEFKMTTGWVQFSHFYYPLLVEHGWVSKEFDENAFKFVFVRNPYDRAVSTYFYLKNYKMITKNGRKDRFEASFTTFKDWCQYLAKREFDPVGLYNNKNRSIYNAQWEWLKGVDLDFIGRFENLQEDFDKLCNMLDIPTKKLEKIRASDHKPYVDYYDDECRELVYDVYKDDFINLDYTP